MLFAERFLKLLFNEYKLDAKLENDERLEFKLFANSYANPQSSLIEESFTFLNHRDEMSLTVTFGEADPISFYSTSIGFKPFLEQLKNEFDHQGKEEIIWAVLSINKRKINNTVSIYSLETFAETLEKLTIAQAFSSFNRVLFQSNFVNFEVYGLVNPIYTATLSFSALNRQVPPNIVEDRLKIIESLRSASYFISQEDYRLTPDDFKVISECADHKKLCNLLNLYSTILSIVYLFDITSLKENSIDYKLNGYKSFSGVVDTSIPMLASEEYYNIYKWVFNGGNLIDKIGLARNIISLHFEGVDGIGLTGSPLQSIQSSYKVYEKQNIKQYIEIRNKMSDQLLEFNNRANKIIETFASGFQKSALALITFYISAISLKVLATGEFLNVFTLDATILSLSFLCGSGIYYKISRWEVKEQRMRFVNSYSNLKERYTDLLDVNDIQRILNADKEFLEDLKFIDEKLKKYSMIWMSFIIILLTATLILFGVYSLSQVFDAPIWKLLFKG